MFLHEQTEQIQLPDEGVKLLPGARIYKFFLNTFFHFCGKDILDLSVHRTHTHTHTAQAVNDHTIKTWPNLQLPV